MTLGSLSRTAGLAFQISKSNSRGQRSQSTSLNRLGTPHMARALYSACALWAFGIGRSLPDRRGRMRYVERLIGTIRRECPHHMIVLGAAHLRRTLGMP